MMLLENGRYYVGSTADLKKRIDDHLSGKGCQTTHDIGAVKCAYSEELEDKTAALIRENQIKRWSQAKKRALAGGELKRLKELARRRVF